MDWITELCRSFAKRLVQEATPMENAQQLISRECAVWNELQAVPSYCERFARPLVIQYEEDDELIHTDEHPFCDDPACGCHDDLELIMEHLEHPFEDGLLTSPEYFRIREGKQL